jgi:hypothetical protein
LNSINLTFNSNFYPLIGWSDVPKVRALSCDNLFSRAQRFHTRPTTFRLRTESLMVLPQPALAAWQITLGTENRPAEFWTLMEYSMWLFSILVMRGCGNLPSLLLHDKMAGRDKESRLMRAVSKNFSNYVRAGSH